jgi:hypothetical protein
MKRSTWLLESAIECTASASIDADPDSSQPISFARAMPMFARNAARIALPPPCALILVSLRPVVL